MVTPVTKYNIRLIMEIFIKNDLQSMNSCILLSTNNITVNSYFGNLPQKPEINNVFNYIIYRQKIATTTYISFYFLTTKLSLFLQLEYTNSP